MVVIVIEYICVTNNVVKISVVNFPINSYNSTHLLWTLKWTKTYSQT